MPLSKRSQLKTWVLLPMERVAPQNCCHVDTPGRAVSPCQSQFYHLSGTPSVVRSAPCRLCAITWWSEAWRWMYNELQNTKYFMKHNCHFSTYIKNVRTFFMHGFTIPFFAAREPTKMKELRVFSDGRTDVCLLSFLLSLSLTLTATDASVRPPWRLRTDWAVRGERDTLKCDLSLPSRSKPRPHPPPGPAPFHLLTSGVLTRSCGEDCG